MMYTDMTTPFTCMLCDFLLAHTSERNIRHTPRLTPLTPDEIRNHAPEASNMASMQPATGSRRHSRWTPRGRGVCHGCIWPGGSKRCTRATAQQGQRSPRVSAGYRFEPMGSSSGANRFGKAGPLPCMPNLEVLGCGGGLPTAVALPMRRAAVVAMPARCHRSRALKPH
jgi:hypothetical protein